MHKNGQCGIPAHNCGLKSASPAVEVDYTLLLEPIRAQHGDVYLPAVGGEIGITEYLGS